MNLKTLLFASLTCVCAASLSLGCGDDSGESANTSSTTSTTPTTTPSTTETTSSATTTGSTSELPEITWTSLEERPCPEDSVLTYSNFGAGVMLDWCVSCHSSSLAQDDRAGAPVGIDFNTIQDVRLHAPRIWARSADDNTSMPTYGGPEPMTRFLLGEWLACGAPE